MSDEKVCDSLKHAGECGHEEMLEVSELGRMSSVSEEKTCEIDGSLGCEVEGTDEILDSSSDEMMFVDEEEKCSG